MVTGVEVALEGVILGSCESLGNPVESLVTLVELFSCLVELGGVLGKLVLGDVGEVIETCKGAGGDITND